MTEPLQVSYDEAARLLGYGKRTVQRMVDNGDIVATGAGRLRRIDMQSIIDKQARMRQGEPPLCQKRKAPKGNTGVAIVSIPTRAAGGSEVSRSAPALDAPKPKLSLLPMLRKHGASSK